MFCHEQRVNKKSLNYLFGFFPLHWPHFACSSAGGERGGTSQPGRAFSVRSDRGRVIQRGVAPPAS